MDFDKMIIETNRVTSLKVLRSGVAQYYDETVPCYNSLHTSIALFRERKSNYNSNHHQQSRQFVVCSKAKLIFLMAIFADTSRDHLQRGLCQCPYVLLVTLLSQQSCLFCHKISLTPLSPTMFPNVSSLSCYPWQEISMVRTQRDTGHCPGHQRAGDRTQLFRPAGIVSVSSVGH